MRADEIIYIVRRKAARWKTRRPSVRLLRGVINLSDSDFVYVIDFDRKNFMAPVFSDEEKEDMKSLTSQQKAIYYVIKASTLNGMVGVRVSRKQLMEQSSCAVPVAYHTALNVLEEKRLIRIYRVRYVSGRRKEGRTVIFVDKYRKPVEENKIKKGEVWTLVGEEDEEV